MSLVAGPRVFELRSSYQARFLDPESLVVLRRAERSGPLHVLEAKMPASLLVGVLDSLAEGSLDTIRLDLGRAALRKQEHSDLVRALGRFPKARIDPPLSTSEPEQREADQGPKVSVQIRIHGAPFVGEPGVTLLFELISKLGLALDSFKVGFRSTHRKLGKEPIAQLAKWTAKTDSFQVYRDGGSDLVSVNNGHGLFTYFETKLAEERARNLLEWITALVDDDRTAIELATITLPQTDLPEAGTNEWREMHHNALSSLWRGWPGWLVVLSGPWCDWLRVERLEALRGEVAGLEGIFARRTRRNLIVGLTPTVLEPPSREQIAAFAAAVERIVVEEWERRRGYRWSGLALEPFRTAAEALGLGPTPEIDDASFRVTFQDSTKRQRLVLVIDDLKVDEPHIRVRLESHAEQGSYRVFDLGTTGVGTLESTQKELSGLAQIAIESGPKWFEDPTKRPRAR